MEYKDKYQKWLTLAVDEEIKTELRSMDEGVIEDAFYRDLVFGTGGIRGVMGAGTNRINVYVVARVSQGLADYLSFGASVVIGYDSRIKSDYFARTAASVFASNGVKVWFWPELNPVSTVSYAIRYLRASAGVMITASHNPSKYNGYKVYGADGCQITTEAADGIWTEIEKLDLFSDVQSMDFDEAVEKGMIGYIDDSVFTAFIEEVKGQSVLYGDEIDRDISIVYTPLNGTGLKPVTRMLSELGFSNFTVVEEQKEPDGNFPTCPYPNPEISEAMELGLQYAYRLNADLLMATDPDADRCGIAVRDGDEYRLLTGNEVGVLLLDYICSQRTDHNQMPKSPVFIKTIVTTDLAEKIAASYGVRTINVLTGFKFIGEQIGRLENKQDFIFGFEESYGYLTGSYVRDKDAVNAVIMIAEMVAFYKFRDISLLQKLNEIYKSYGYCLNTLHSFEFSGSAGMKKMEHIMADFRVRFENVGGWKIVRVEDYGIGLYGLPKTNVLKYYCESENEENGYFVIRPSGTEPKLKVYISLTAENESEAYQAERNICIAIEKIILKQDF